MLCNCWAVLYNIIIMLKAKDEQINSFNLFGYTNNKNKLDHNNEWVGSRKGIW